MRHSFTLFLIALLLLLASCGTGNRVMDTGVLQKRKHLPGWDLTLRAKKPVQNNGRPINTEVFERPDRTTSTKDLKPEVGSASEVADLLVSNPDQEIYGKKAPPLLSGTTRDRTSARSETEQVAVPSHEDLQDPELEERPKKRWNKFAIPAFMAALGTIYLGLFSVSTIAVIVALVITFTLSGISLRQIRSRDEAGKGFALIALILGLLAAMATAMVTYVVGFI